MSGAWCRKTFTPRLGRLPVAQDFRARERRRRYIHNRLHGRSRRYERLLWHDGDGFTPVAMHVSVHIPAVGQVRDMSDVHALHVR
jgi:hypothetical protein